MVRILTVAEAVAWKVHFLVDWPYPIPGSEVKVLFASHEALRAQVVALTAGLRDTLTEIHLNLGCDPDCEEKRHVLLPDIGWLIP